jgi:signal transduction histidine kinase
VLRRRLARERAARHEAERIAETATRRLYDRQRELELIGASAQAANEAVSIEAALRDTVELVCRHTSWPVGHAFLTDPGDALLHSGPVWHLAGERFDPFRRLSDKLVFKAGEGLPGRVVQDGAAVWLSDLAEAPEFQRQQTALECGLRAALGVPVVVAERPVGALEFFIEAAGPPEPGLVAVLTQVGTQLGRVVERARGQAELERLAGELSVRNDALARSNADLEVFASVASHDMAEPLRTASGFLTLLEERHGEGLDAQGREFLAFAQRGIQRLQVMIKDMLEYARAGTRQRGELAVEAGAMLEEAIRSLSTRIDASGATVRFDRLPALSCDQEGLTRVFQNLLANALKYVAQDTPPVVTVSAERSGDAWCFSVADNGIGVPEAARTKIFEMFGRGADSQDYEGSGIGLAVCARVVDAHGGRIWVDSGPDGGSVFRFTVKDP